MIQTTQMQNGMSELDNSYHRSTASQIGYTLKYLIPTDIAAGVAFFLLWYFIGVADIPLVVLNSTFANANAAIIYGPNYAANITFPYINSDASFTSLSVQAVNSSFLIAADLCNTALFGSKVHLQTIA